ncbi:tryptophan 2,3-dioxygenase family protein [Woeseiaceae bacterium]|nr:tryptophan 2,3-dioxygenase family protein [Woeseiaceae bacterium]
MTEIKSSIIDGIETFEAEINGEKIEWDDELTYNSHLQTERLLSAQIGVSGKPDETLFIIIHQTMELWIKLCLHELGIVIECIKKDQLSKSFKTFDRIAAIQRHMIQSWEILATLTPHDFLTFRGYLRKASGFQSHQYRELEFLLGNKNRDLTVVHRDNKPVYEQLMKVLNAPSLYDETLKLLSKKGFVVPSKAIDRDWSEPYQSSPEIEEVWRLIYEDTEKYWELYMLAERVTALEYYFQEWRFKHMKTVSRVIGYSKGTAGSSGVDYLVKALNLSFFPELWSMRTKLSTTQEENNSKCPL